MYGEVEYELRVIEGDARAGGVVYDGRRLAQILQSVLGHASLEECHIVATDRLVSTFSDDDLRHHLRTVVFGFPSVISIPGIVEAPARPREYWVKRKVLEASGTSQIELERLKAEFKGRFLDFEDPLIFEVLKGLALQCVMYHLTLEPFCDNKDCRLFNAHWQEDLIRSQIDKGSLCNRHTKLVRSLGRSPTIRWMDR